MGDVLVQKHHTGQFVGLLRPESVEEKVGGVF